MIKTVQCYFCGEFRRPRKTKKVIHDDKKVIACDDCHNKLKNGGSIKKL